MADWHVSPNVKDNPNPSDPTAGKSNNPWSLSHAASGASGKIQPGDTVIVHGGIYPSEKGFNIAVSGNASAKITFKAAQHEQVILDGSIFDSASIPNTAWEPFAIQGSGHNVYRSMEPIEVPSDQTIFGGFIKIGGEFYSLAQHKTIEYLSSDTQKWDDLHPFYVGPGIAQDATAVFDHNNPHQKRKVKHIYIRLDQPDPVVQLHRPVPTIGDPDPRQHEIYVCSNLEHGLTISGSHLVIEGFAQINNYECCFQFGKIPPTDVTIRSSGGRPVRVGARCGHIDGLVLDSCNFEAHMPNHKWWVSYADIKSKVPTSEMKKTGLDLGTAKNVEVRNCRFEDFFDGILADGKPQDGPHDIQVHHSHFIHNWDDAWQMYGNLYHVDFHHNVCLGAGPSVDHTGTNEENVHPGTVYIHHNTIDTTDPLSLLFWARCGHCEAGVHEPIALSTHVRRTLFTFPRKLYYNTIITGAFCGTQVGWALLNAGAKNSEATHEVFNNIFVATNGQPGGRDFDATSGREIYDGNVYWHYFALHSLVRSPWTRLRVSNRPEPIHDDRNLITVDDLKESQAFKDSKAYYPPGWENSGLSVDPQLDEHYKPTNLACQTGAVDLTQTQTNPPWPGTASYEPWRGAVKP